MTSAAGSKKTKHDAAPAVSIRDRLIAATLELAKTMSLHEMSQARVAAAAGVRHSHLTYYFPARVDLIKAAVLAIRDEILLATDLIAAVTETGGNPVLAVRGFFASNVRDMPKARMMLSLMLAADEDPSLRAWLEQIDRESIDQLYNLLVALGYRAKREDVELFQITFVGAVLHGTQLGSQTALERASHLTEMAFDRLIQSATPV